MPFYKGQAFGAKTVPFPQKKLTEYILWASSLQLEPGFKELDFEPKRLIPVFGIAIPISGEYLVTNLHLSKEKGKRPLLLILGGSNEGFTYAPGDWRIEDFLNRGYHVL